MKENIDSYYLVELIGTELKAKISLNKIDIIIQYKWYLGKNGYPFAYKERRKELHRYIWYLNNKIWKNNYINQEGKIIKLYIDHINRDKLDATDENLRLCIPAENSYNKTSKNSIQDPITLKPLHHIKLQKSGYSVTLTKDGKISNINKIATLEEAKNIYNMMANELFGDYAVLYD